MDPATAAAAAQATQQLYQVGAVGAMLVLCTAALGCMTYWIFKSFDKRLDDKDKSAEADRKEYSKTLLDVVEKQGGHIARSTEVLEKVSEGQSQLVLGQTQILARLDARGSFPNGNGPGGNNWGGARG